MRKDRSVALINLALRRGSSGGPTVDGLVQDFLGRTTAELHADAPFFSSGLLPANHFAGKYQVALRPRNLELLTELFLPPARAI